MQGKIINPWKKLSSKKIYRNQWFSLREDQVISPGGEQGIYGANSSVRPSGFSEIKPLPGPAFVNGHSGEGKSVFRVHKVLVPVGVSSVSGAGYMYSCDAGE